MNLTTLRRSAVLAGIPAILLAGSMLPAEAVNSVGLVGGGSDGPSGSVSGNCAYTATLPSTNFQYLSVTFTGVATAEADLGVVPVSTSIVCELQKDAWGQAGLTAPGAASAAAGRGDVWRLALDPEICVTVSAAFSDGTVAPPVKTCHNL